MTSGRVELLTAWAVAAYGSKVTPSVPLPRPPTRPVPPVPQMPNLPPGLLGMMPPGLGPAPPAGEWVLHLGGSFAACGGIALHEQV